MLRFRVPEIFLGCFLTVAVFAAGAVVRPYSDQPAHQVSAAPAEGEGKEKQSEGGPGGWWPWLFKDAAGFFTLGLVAVGVGQAFLFFVQLRYMRAGMRDATMAALAAKVSADAAMKSAAVSERALTELERPWIFVFNVSRPTLEAGDDFFVEYTVANYGKMPAIVVSPRIGFVFSDANGNPQAPTFSNEDHSLVAAPILKAGEERRLREYFPTNPQHPVSFQVINEGTLQQSLIQVPSLDISPGLQLFLRAEISYRGPTSKGHETGANWLYREPWDLVLRGDEYNYTK